jgi:hypothetical protein
LWVVWRCDGGPVVTNDCPVVVVTGCVVGGWRLLDAQRSFVTGWLGREVEALLSQ